MKSIKFFLISILMCLGSLTGSAQNCEAYFPMKEGAFVEMKNYNARDKLTGTVQYTVKEKTITGNRISVKVDTKTFDQKDELIFENEMEMYCEDGVFYIDMENYLSDEMFEQTEEMEISVESTNMEMPAQLEEGMKLSDGSISLSMSAGGISAMNMMVSITNRVVEGKENVTTPAGTFECYKISYDLVTKTIMRMTTKAAEWYAKDIGVVKSESYNKNGKLTGYTLLTRFKE